ncbi:hypothetical protein PPGU19_088480 (plasmid) [Paraburkholderia sp. PGU19]|nr:hypothetical protein PPGU19_088480 [Paraburkholderia sp. PGU19]
MYAGHDSRITRITPRLRARLLSGALLSAVALPALAQTATPGFPAPTPHSQQAYDPESSFTMRWTRADIRQIKAQSHAASATDKNSLPLSLTMPDIPQDFPLINPNVWVWDTWPLADMRANQLAYKGWEVIFSLTADPHAGYTFDDRHVHARIGFFYRRAGVPASRRPANGGWTWGGHLFPDGASVKVFGTSPMTDNAEWSGSARLTHGDNVSLYYTATSFNRSAPAAPTLHRRRRSSRAPTVTSTPTTVTCGSQASMITRHCSSRTAPTIRPGAEHLLLIPRSVRVHRSRTSRQDLHGIRRQHGRPARRAHLHGS